MFGRKASLAVPTLDLWEHEAEGDWRDPLVRRRLPVAVESCYVAQLENLIAVIGGSAEPVVSGREGALTLAATLAVARAIAEGRRGRRRRAARMTKRRELSLAALGFLELDPPALLDVAAGAGFSSVSLRTWAAVPGGPEYPLLEGEPLGRRTRERIDATGVGILQIELVSLARDVEIESYRPVLEGGAALGAARVVACGDDEDGVVVERLAELCDLAADLGMSVDVEFMPFRRLATLPQALAVVARADRDNACVMIDALHLFRSGGSVADVTAAPPSRIGVCQLCDAPLVGPARC